MQNFLIILSLVIPVFIIVALGYVLKRGGLINDNFVKMSSAIVFRVSLPALIFNEISTLDISEDINLWIIVFVYLGTLVNFALNWLISVPLVKQLRDRTVFIQGAFRGNFAIIGLSLISNVFGAAGLGKGSLVLAFTIPLYNMLSIIALTVPLRGERKTNISATMLEIIKNPLTLGVFLAIPFSYFDIPIHHTLQITINYLAALTLPLALLGIGGFLNFSDIRQSSYLAFVSTFIKIVIVPIGCTIAAYWFGFRGNDLGVIFIFFACPTAIASFIMAEAMGSNSRLAANILLVTTLGSVITITLGLFILKENGLI